MRQTRVTVLPLVIIVVVMVALGGCTQRILDFTVVSSKNTEMAIPMNAKGDRVEGKDSVPIILVPIGTPSLKEAIDRAIESAGPEYDALIDGVLYYKFIYFFVGVAEYKVEGTPIVSSRINVSLGEGGDDQVASSGPILFHSRTKKANDEAIRKIGITPIDS